MSNVQVCDPVSEFNLQSRNNIQFGTNAFDKIMNLLIPFGNTLDSNITNLRQDWL